MGHTAFQGARPRRLCRHGELLESSTEPVTTGSFTRDGVGLSVYMYLCLYECIYLCLSCLFLCV